VKIQIVAVGNIKEKHFKDAIAEYGKRLSRFCKLEIIEVDEEINPKEQNGILTQRVLSKEAAKIMPRLRNCTVIALDVKGDRMSSERFAEQLKEYFYGSGGRDIVFVVGGSLGLDESVLNAAKLKLSMSDMTFPHQMARVMLIEQIYRAFKITNNEKYHK
jgi:23S rRNA (pseudouridine1915-N3)-methyltransferase